MFVCLGNICRSTMAEAVFRKYVIDNNLKNDYYIRSGGTCAEINHGVHYGTIKKLKSVGINPDEYIVGNKGYQVVLNDYEKYDVFYCMDSSNVRNLKKIFNGDKDNKVKLFLDRDIKDPWYTGNFDETYEDILEAISKKL